MTECSLSRTPSFSLKEPKMRSYANPINGSCEILGKVDATVQDCCTRITLKAVQNRFNSPMAHIFLVSSNGIHVMDHACSVRF